jgi:hypothetical protein
MNSNQSRNVKVTKFLLHETGSYNTQYRRPYNTNLTGAGLNMMVERLGGASSYEASMMGGIANQFISPVATPEKQIAMINGWNERRMRFMMEVEYSYYTGGKITEVILGYTNYNGVGINGSIDPNMEFYINSTLHVRNNIEYTPTGNQNHISVADSSHVLVDNNWTGVYSSNKEQRMRPEDVYSTMSRSQIAGIGDGSLLDTRAMSSTIAVKSRRNNASAANYMSTILKGYSQAAMSAEFGMGDQEILSKARGFARESLASKDPFLLAIAQIRGMAVGNIFTFNDLKLLDSNIEYVTKANLMAPTVQAGTHQSGQTADWGGSDIYTTVATILSQSIPSLLMDLALTRIVFKSSNRDIGSVIRTMIYDAQGFSSGDQSQALDTFILRLEHEILRDVSFDNGIDFALEMHIDLLGETWVKLSLDGGPVIDYVTPSFCDALMTPVITMDDQRAVTLASDFELLTSTLLDNNSKTRINQQSGTWASSHI